MANALTEFFGEMIADIRHKVVEQGWFGREVTAAQDPPAADCPPAPLPPGLLMDDSLYGWAGLKDAMDKQHACAADDKTPGEPQAPAPDPGYDIDR